MSLVYAGNFIYASDANGPAPVNNNGINNQAVTSLTDTTTSATFVNMAGTGSITSYNWEKKYDDTQILILFQAGWQGVTANVQQQFAVQINGTDYTVAQGLLTTGEPGDTSGFRLVSGVAAGVYAPQGRWRRTAGGGTATRDINSWLSIMTLEVG